MTQKFKLKCKCGHVLVASNDLVGKVVQCPKCDLKFKVPAPKQAGANPAPTAPEDPLDPWQDPLLADDFLQSPLASPMPGQAMPGQQAMPGPTQQASSGGLKSQKAKTPSKNSLFLPLLITGVAVGLLLVVGGVIAVVMLSSSKPKSQQTANKTPAPVSNTPQPGDPAPIPQGNSNPVIGSQTPATGTLTSAEIDQFGQQFESLLVEGMRQKKFTKLNRLIDYPKMIDRALSDLASNNRSEAKTIIQRILLEYNGIVKHINVFTIESFNYLGPRNFEGKSVALFRKLTAGTTQYVELELIKNADGKVVAIDCFDYANEQFSKRLSHELIYASDIDSLPIQFQPNTLLDIYQKNIALIARVEESRGQERVAQINQMPEKLKQEPWVALAYWNSVKDDPRASQQGEKIVRNMLSNSRYSKWLLLSLCYKQRNVNSAIGYIDDLDQALGGDPYLNIFRADLYFVYAMYPKAKAALAKYEKTNGPRDELYHLLQVTVFIADRNQVGAINYIKKVDPNRQKNWRKLLASPGFRNFINSQLFLEWEGRR